MRNLGAHLTAAVFALVLVVAVSCEREPQRRASKQGGSAAGTLAPPRRGEYRMSTRGLERIRKNEAFVPKVYDDGVGNQTIGYGHMLRPGESFGGGINEAEAQALFEKDVSRIVDPALRRITTPLTQNQIDALGSFIYNVGPGNFQRSVLSEVNEGDHAGVTAAMSKYTKGRNQRTGERLTMRGLVRRRLEEVGLYKTPAGSTSLLFPGQEWTRAARRLLANGMQFLRAEPACLLDPCRKSRSSS